jgi:hypothetical protein
LIGKVALGGIGPRTKSKESHECKCHKHSGSRSLKKS